MKFAVVSDVHAEQHPDWTRLVFERMARRSDLEFVAFLGDICTSPWDSWEQHFRPLQSLIRCPIFACRGNHDDQSRWRQWWGLPDDFVRLWPNVRCVFWDSNDWAAGGQKSQWLREQVVGPERYKFLFTHLTPRTQHWTYGLGPNRTRVMMEVCKAGPVTASFTGHMHGFDVLKQDGTLFFICGGGGGSRHDDFPVMHRSNYYLVVECGDHFHVSLCQQHRDREQVRPMEEWINCTAREGF